MGSIASRQAQFKNASQPEPRGGGEPRSAAGAAADETAGFTISVRLEITTVALTVGRALDTAARNAERPPRGGDDTVGTGGAGIAAGFSGVPGVAGGAATVVEGKRGGCIRGSPERTEDVGAETGAGAPGRKVICTPPEAGTAPYLRRISASPASPGGLSGGEEAVGFPKRSEFGTVGGIEISGLRLANFEAFGYNIANDRRRNMPMMDEHKHSMPDQTGTEGRRGPIHPKVSGFLENGFGMVLVAGMTLCVSSVISVGGTSYEIATSLVNTAFHISCLLILIQTILELFGREKVLLRADWQHFSCVATGMALIACAAAVMIAIFPVLFT